MPRSLDQTTSTWRTVKLFLSSSVFILTLSACGGGGGGSTTPPVVTPPPPKPISKAFNTEASTQRFLMRATFGARKSDITSLRGTDASIWLAAELEKPAALLLPTLIAETAELPENQTVKSRRLTDLYLDNAIAGNDQLRQRMVLALSEIIVVSNGGELDEWPLGMAYYIDILSKNAFGNYRELLEEVSYSPAMALWLTYLKNQKGDPETGRMPDENYAREILQLFSIGLVELNMDGTQKLDGSGNSIEVYDNTDITGLAKVFTGLSTDNGSFALLYRDRPAWYRPMVFYPDRHSQLEKKFLDITIPANTPGAESLDLALDEIFKHPNLAPFVSRQLIQRFVTSHPQPAYIGRVSAAFESGTYTLIDGTQVGTGTRGDLKATIAAVLMDVNALRDPAQAPATFGKVREPIIRIVNWARAFNETTPDVADEQLFRKRNDDLRQRPFGAPSVFNFFRPGYIASGLATGDANLTAPELQIVNESSAIDYINYLNDFIYDYSPTYSDNPEGGINADYTRQITLADNAKALVDDLDLLLTGNSLEATSKARIIELLNTMPVNSGSAPEDRASRVHIAVSMVMTSPGYLVQR